MKCYVEQSCIHTVKNTLFKQALYCPAQVQPLSIWDATHHLFEYWKRIVNHPEFQLDARRRPLIARALKLGYSVEALYQAILGSSFTPHRQEHNEPDQRFDGLHIILQDSDPIDRFIHNAEYPPKSLNGSEWRLSRNLQRRGLVSRIQGKH